MSNADMDSDMTKSPNDSRENGDVKRRTGSVSGTGQGGDTCSDIVNGPGKTPVSKIPQLQEGRVSSSRDEYRTGNISLQKRRESSRQKDPHKELDRNEEKVQVSKQLQILGTNRLYYVCLMLVTCIALATRLYNIEIPSHVCWDETHFGKMGSWYIKHSFFFDVHPPLGKMLIGLSGYLTGYDGEFPFSKPGDDYGETKYVGMRVFCAILGSALVPLVYMSSWQLSQSTFASLFAAVLVICDTGTLTLSRHILLDPILMFFIMTATYCVLKFLSYRERTFCLCWWFWLLLTGVALACSIGVKFVGLFVVLLVGYTTATDLWRLLGNHSLPCSGVAKHFFARAACLIVLPVAAYMAIFAVHFKVLSESGNGDGFYSSAFQSQLKGNRLYNVSMPENIAFGSVFTLKHRKTVGGYLHSHWHLYPEDHPPRQQQITTYSHKDENNMWKIKPANNDASESEKPQLVRSGDLVQLEHIITHRNLHSHREPAPLTKRHFQVTGYGENGVGDANDVWVLEVDGAPLGTPVQTVKSKLKLIHYHVRCALQSHDKKLPKWGWEQLEVTCNPNVRDTKTLWSVEEVIDARLPNVSFEVYSPSFLEKFLESHAVMTQGNSGLKPKEGEVTSRPWQWPINLKGQIFSGKDHRIYLLGNPVLFWSCLGLMGVFILLYAVHAVKRQRGIMHLTGIIEYNERIFGACWWLVLAWALHYLPFWPMTRVLYFHHYFPAFMYSAMLSGIILDYLITRLSVAVPESLSLAVFHTCTGSVLAGVCYSFYRFHPLSYGMSGPLAADEASSMHGLKWLDSWDI